ncbi:MAG TPA: LUD domain-containing protein [Dongiaceae bacterium]
MNDRETILQTIRTRKRLSGSPLEAGPVPARGQITGAARRELFLKMAQAAAATIDIVDDPSDIPERISRYLASQNLPPRLVLSSDPAIANLPWADFPLLAHRTGPATGQDHAALTRAFAAVAETGTLALLSGPETPTTLNFLPEHCLVLLSASAICGTYEELWQKLRGATEGGVHWPRTVNLVTGPSRSADIEQKLLMGAHGPVKLHILLLDD